MTTKKHTKSKQPSDLTLYLTVALVIALGFVTYNTFTIPQPGAPAPAPELTLTYLGVDCEDCFDITVVKDFLSQQGITAKTVEEKTIAQSRTLAEQYGITKLPTAIITGDIEGITLDNFDAKDDALILNQAPAPYYDLESDTVKGLLTLTILQDGTCTECFDMSQIIQQLEQVGVNIAEQHTIERSSEEGQDLINKYNIDVLPTILFSKDLAEYETVTQVWSEVGTVEADGTHVLRFVNPPYLNVTSGELEGVVDLTYLVDETCPDCYDTSVFKGLFKESFNMAFGDEETVDISSTRGQFFINKYNISLVPTVILGKEANAYPNFAEAWNQVGTKEEDGAFVFTSIPLLDGYFKQTQQADGIMYKDLSTGETVNTAAVVETTAPQTNTTE